MDQPFPPVDELLGKRTIITGEVNTGKTGLLRRILKDFRDQGHRDLALIDMAPTTTKGIGGKMDIQGLRIPSYYPAATAAPRLTGKTPDGVRILAQRNAEIIDEAFLLLLKAPTRMLFINDVSMYLQTGELANLLSHLKYASTIVMNGYYGYSLGGGELGKRERDNMRLLQQNCDLVIEL